MVSDVDLHSFFRSLHGRQRNEAEKDQHDDPQLKMVHAIANRFAQDCGQSCLSVGTAPFIDPGFEFKDPVVRKQLLVRRQIDQPVVAIILRFRFGLQADQPFKQVGEVKDRFDDGRRTRGHHAVGIFAKRSDLRLQHRDQNFLFRVAARELDLAMKVAHHAVAKLVAGGFGAEGGAFCDLFRLLLLTGQRRAEVGGMLRAELSDLDGDKPTWEIPSDRTKNGRPHIVPLAPLVVTIIKARPTVGEAGFLFTTNGENPVSGFSKTKERVDGRIARKREEAGIRPMPDWTLHDLRRTIVTLMNERLGIAPHVVEACVNHISGGAKAGVAGVYNKALYLAERREAMTAWAAYVEALVKPGKND